MPKVIIAPDDPKNKVPTRCPRMGSTVTLGYCRTTGEKGLPCFKIFDCWWETFDIVRFMEDTLEPEDFKKLAASRPKPRVASLVEVAQKAKERSR